MIPLPLTAATWTAAFARCASFAALAPLAGSGAVPRALRFALAIGLTPAVEAHVRIAARGQQTEVTFIENALIGSAFGLAAAVVAAAASSAGSLVDATLSSNAIGREAVFGGNGGPFARVFALAFAVAFLSSGAMTRVCERFVSASSDAAIAPTVHGAIGLVRESCDAAIVLAAPAMLAQLLGTIIAGAVARAAPRVNGLMLASPLVTALLLLAILAALPSTTAHIIDLARAAATAPAL